MEDFPTEDQEEDKKKKKKKRLALPSFISTYLGIGEKDKEEPKKPFSERAWGVFQRFFNHEAERPAKIENSKPETEKRPAFLDFTEVETEQIVPNSPEQTESELANQAEREELEPEQPNEGGELVVDHREEEDEAWRANADELLAYELPPEVEPPFIPLERRPELVEMYDREESATTPTSQPEKLGDLLERRQKQTERDLTREKQRNRRRNRRLKKQVRELKHETQDAAKQRETLKKEQTELETQVERLKKQPEVSQLIARQERERAELRASRGMAARPEIRSVEQPKPMPQTEQILVPVPEALPRRLEPENPRQTETMVQQFEQIPQEDARSERDFERRHEVKDEAGSQPAATYAALASADAAYRTAAAQVGQATPVRNYPAPPPLPNPQPAFQASDLIDSPMYRQAMRNGFLTAIILLAVWFVISLLS